jgi:outer membrane protein assembly factor BamB
MKPPFPRLFLLCLALSLAAVSGFAADPSADNWPRFRGPGGNGVAGPGEWPIACDVATGANVAWKSPVPAAGFGSPVVWGDRVFLSGGDESARVVLCYEAATGQLLWKSAVPPTEGSPAEPPEVPAQCGMAAATVCTDGARVYAMFANGDLAAFDFAGKPVWAKHLADLKNAYGHASSPILWQGKVILQLDQGEADDQLSKLCCFEGATGALVWEQPRAVGASWATPIVCEVAGRAEIVTLAVPSVIAYAAADGAEIWRADCMDGEVTPSPIFAGGTLFVVNPSNKLQAIRPDGEGDVSKTHLGWGAEDNIPDVTSPVSDGALVFVLDSSGVLTCYDAKNGRKQWDHDYNEPCNASPSLAGGRLYVITRKGTLLVLEAGRAFKELSRSELGEPVFASPAFAHQRIFVRGKEHLFCLEGKTGSVSK